MNRRDALCGVIIAGAAVCARAYEIHTLTSPHSQTDGFYGASIASGEDVDHDGYADVVIGAYGEAHSSGTVSAGRAYVISGQSGQVLYTLESPSPGWYGCFGLAVSFAGDFDGDGFADIVVGAPNEDNGVPDAGGAYLFGGRDGRLLGALRSPAPQFNGLFGWSVARAGDANEDGYDDVIVGALQENGGAVLAGRAYVFGGPDGVLLLTLELPSPQDYAGFGFSVDGGADVDGDGRDDLAVGAPGKLAGEDDAGATYVFSGADGAPLHTIPSPAPEFRGYFGIDVTFIDDVTADGCGDLIVGAKLEDGGTVDGGRAYVLSGADGALVHTLESPNCRYWGYFGYSVAGTDDLNGDGCRDVLVGAFGEHIGETSCGRAYTFSGRDGSLLHTLTSPDQQDLGRFGWAVSGAGKVNDDPWEDVVVGAWSEDGDAQNSGRVYVVTPSVILDVQVASSVELRWLPHSGAAAYWVYGTPNDPYFSPGLTPPFQDRLAALPASSLAWDTSVGQADPGANWVFLVVAIDDSAQEMSRSNRVAEWDVDMAIP